MKILSIRRLLSRIVPVGYSTEGSVGCSRKTKIIDVNEEEKVSSSILNKGKGEGAQKEKHISIGAQEEIEQKDQRWGLNHLYISL